MQLIHGDCLDEMKNIPDGSIDMVLADPPYGTTQCKWDSIIDLGLMWEQLERVVKPNGAIVMTASQPFTSALVISNPKMFKYSLVWKKSQSTGHLNAWKMPLRAHEDILVFYKKPPVYNPKLKDKDKKNIRPITPRTKTTECYGDHKLDSHKCPPDKSMPTSILEFNNAQKTIQPTQKPVDMFEYLIKTYSMFGDTVLDFCFGSGTTAVACENTGRRFIGIEKGANEFCNARERIKKMFPQYCSQI